MSNPDSTAKIETPVLDKLTRGEAVLLVLEKGGGGPQHHRIIAGQHPANSLPAQGLLRTKSWLMSQPDPPVTRTGRGRIRA